MARNETQEPRSRSNSISAAWSYFWRSSKQQHPTQHNQQDTQDSPSKPLTIQEEADEDEDRALGKGITRKVLPQQRRPTSSTQSSPFSSSRTSPKTEPSRISLSQEQQRPQQQLQPSALERIAIHNGNINNALAATMQHSMSLPPMNRIDDIKDAIHEGTLAPAVEDGRSQYHSRLRQQQQQQHPQQRSGHGRKLSVPEGTDVEVNLLTLRRIRLQQARTDRLPLHRVVLCRPHRVPHLLQTRIAVFMTLVSRQPQTPQTLFCGLNTSTIVGTLSCTHPRCYFPVPACPPSPNLKDEVEDPSLSC
ncbi:hypothetical protein EDD21DRAFT_358114 [Dissophora ornata]|nr:hypothetical protein EDD21DRAFT_358114 [Dissophora ornata]